MTALALAGTPAKPAIRTSRGAVVAVPVNTRAGDKGVYPPENGAGATAAGSCADAELVMAVEASAPVMPISHTVKKITKRFMEGPLSW